MKISAALLSFFIVLAVVSAGGTVLLHAGVIDKSVAWALTDWPVAVALFTLIALMQKNRLAARAKKEQLTKLLAGRQIRVWSVLFLFLFWINIVAPFWGSASEFVIPLLFFLMGVLWLLYPEWRIRKIRAHYAALELPTSATLEEIEAAHKTLGMMHHPYRNQDNAAAAAKRFKKIEAAYVFLSQDKKNAAMG